MKFKIGVRESIPSVIQNIPIITYINKARNLNVLAKKKYTRAVARIQNHATE